MADLLSEKNFTASFAYRERVHDLIPGGAHTYSKGDDQFPWLAPAAIRRGEGAWLWDVDGNKFLDCSMGLTSVSLGHAYRPVLNAVRAELENGVNFQRPSVLEKTMAESFLSLVPGHDMIKFAKNGSTATTAAVKLARAHTGRTHVAFPSDHPFFSYDDWFIGSTACDRGVPGPWKEMAFTFPSGDLAALERLFLEHPGKIACVISEPERAQFDPPAPDYFDQITSLCHRYGALSIMDEMITGFKTAFPGSIAKGRLAPDLATWGKGIANGFSFCALTGKKDIMELGGIRRHGQEKVFLISSTHGGETHAMAACLATIAEFREKNVVAHNHAAGAKVRDGVRAALAKAGLASSIKVTDTPWMLGFAFTDNTGAADAGLRTLFMQEMIKRGVLFQGVFVPCFSHGENETSFFLTAFEACLPVYAAGLEQGYANFLIGDPARPVFRKIL